MKKVELLAPAGNMEKMKMAILYGADAVYLAGKGFGLRAYGGNFTNEELQEAVIFAHDRNRKVYVTVNIIPRNEDLNGLGEYLQFLESIHVDAALISDLGVFQLAREVAPQLPIHISTQASSANWRTVKAWKDMGAERVVMAREVSVRELSDIHKHVDVELEVFAHGAMCISWSGRCLLSNFFTKGRRQSNKGECIQACRFKYSVVEESRPGQYWPVEDDEHGTYIFNSKDLCMIDHIPELVDAGIDSFKIEGRMKTALYVATVARTYRMAIDDYFENPKKYEENIPKYKTLISQCTYRQYTTGFFFGKPDETTQIYDCNVYERDYVYLGISGEPLEDGSFVIEQKNKFCVGDKIEIMKADGRDIEANVISITDQDGVAMESCPHPKQIITIKLDQVPEAGDILRMKAE